MRWAADRLVLTAQRGDFAVVEFRHRLGGVDGRSGDRAGHFLFGGYVQHATSIRAYYCGALAALRHIEARRPTGRRFGADADARWSSFRGDLTTADRIDLLIRDADAQWPGAFGARNVFALRAVAEDEPFGVGWQPLDPVDAEDVWRAETGRSAATDVGAAVVAVAAAWQLTLGATAVGAISPADKFVVAGPSAIAAVLAAFSQGQDLDWGDQVVVVATPPGHRQLGALGAALVNVATPAVLLTRTELTSISGKRRAIVSDDADEGDARRARAIADGVTG